MDRRTFVATMAGSLLAAPLAVEAQKAAKVSRVGYLAAAGSGWVAPIIDAFYAGLREQGYVIGRDVLVVERYTDGTPEQFLTAATDLLALRLMSWSQREQLPRSPPRRGPAPLQSCSTRSLTRSALGSWRALTGQAAM